MIVSARPSLLACSNGAQTLEDRGILTGDKKHERRGTVMVPEKIAGGLELSKCR